MTELEKITAKIEAAESKLEKLEKDGASEERLISCENNLVELRKEKNHLLTSAGNLIC